MGKAARAIIIENGKILVMFRNKEGIKYYTLVGGRLNDNENAEDALAREVMEETGMRVTEARLVYTESHSAPYNEQFVYLCDVAPHQEVAIQDAAEEAQMNKVEINIHTPMWANLSSFKTLPFRTPQLQEAIVKALKKGFPKEPQSL
jgi:ADP-ribose pyrophosphatase YjhB (NUDIX family)